MNYFKRFGDFCSGLSAFMAFIYLFRKFMSYEPIDKELGMLGKLKEFLSPTGAPENKYIFVLGVMLVISVLGGCILSRLPYLTPIFSLPPLALTVDMIKAEYLPEYPMLHLLLAIFGFLGGVYECTRRDKCDRGRRASVCGNAVCAFSAIVFLGIYKKSGELVLLSDEARTELSAFDSEILHNVPHMNMGIILIFASSCVLFIAVNLLHRDIYFIDAILALPPVIAAIYLWNAEKLTVHPELVITLLLAALAARIIPTFAGGAVYSEIPNKGSNILQTEEKEKNLT